MSTEQIYAEFEKWWHAPGQHELRISRAKGLGFRIWQSSRAAIEIQLPQKCGHLNMINGHVIPEAASYDEAIEDCADSIRAAGITVKE